MLSHRTNTVLISRRLDAQIGNWNFNKTYFISSGMGYGETEESAMINSRLDMNRPTPSNEESFMMAGQ